MKAAFEAVKPALETIRDLLNLGNEFTVHVVISFVLYEMWGCHSPRVVSELRR
jgi:hypothetical protein